MYKRKCRAFWLFAVLSPALFVVAPRLRAQSGPVVWAVPSLTRVARDEPAGGHHEMALWAARGEYESFQVVVRAPAGGLKNVNVAISDLTRSEEHTSELQS